MGNLEDILINIKFNADLAVVKAVTENLKVLSKEAQNALSSLGGFQSAMTNKLSAFFQNQKGRQLETSIVGKDIAARLKQEQELAASGFKDVSEIGGFSVQDLGIDVLTKKIKKSTSAMKGWGREVGMNLSLMFGFMMLYRGASRVVKGLIRNYKELTKEGANPLSLSLTRLEANFKFLQFSLMDVMSPFLISLADGLSSLALSIAKSDPSTLRRIGEALLVFTAITGLGMVATQLNMFVKLGLLPLFELVTTKKVALIERFGVALKGLKGAIAGGLIVDFTVREARLLKSDGGTIIDNLLNVSEATIAGALIGSLFPGGALIGAIIGFTVGLLATVANIMIKNNITPKDVFSAFLETLRKGPIHSNNIFFDALQDMPVFGIGVTASLHLSKIINDKKKESKNGLKPTLENLEAASILSNTTAEEISNLGTTIQKDLVPAFSGDEGLNAPLSSAKENLSSINDSTLTMQTNLTKIKPVLDDSATAHSNLASTLNDEAAAYREVAKAYKFYLDTMNETNSTRTGATGTS